MKLYKPYYKIIIAVYACATIPKYREQILKIRETWGKRAIEKNMLVLFFLGEELTDLIGDEYIYLPGVKNDYDSASLKQNLGIKYIIENYNFDFIHICGTDTFLVIDNMEKLIQKYDSTENIAIGGHGCHRDIDGEKVYFMSGGPGFLLSIKCCNLLYNYLGSLYEDWKKICIDDHNEYLIPCCDVAISYYLQKKINTRIAKEDDKFFHCNFYGYPCHIGRIDNTKIVSCHLMSMNDFDIFHKLLENTMYYV